MTRRKPVFVLALVSAVIAALLGPVEASAGEATGAASAASAAATRLERQAQLKDDIAELSEEEADLLVDLNDVEAALARLDANVAAAEADLASATTRRAAADALLTEAVGTVLGAGQSLGIATSQLRLAMSELQDQAVAAFVAGGPDAIRPGPPLISSLRDVGAAQLYTEAVAHHDGVVVQTVDHHKQAVAGAAARAEVAEAQAREASEAASREQAGVANIRDVLSSARIELAEAVGRQATLLVRAQELRTKFEAELAALELVSSGIAALLAQAQNGQLAGISTAGLLSWPVPPIGIGSGFGPRLHPIFGFVRMHNGIDMTAAFGTPIQAAADAWVVSAEPHGGYGEAVILDHGSGVGTLYAHQSLMVVTPGQYVLRGQVIGYVGSTGLSTGPHLHFEVRLFGAPIDPLRFLS